MKKLMLDDLLTNVLTYPPVVACFCVAVGVSGMNEVTDWSELVDSLWRQTDDGGLAADPYHELGGYECYILLIKPDPPKRAWVVFMTADGMARHFWTRHDALLYVSAYGHRDVPELAG